MVRKEGKKAANLLTDILRPKDKRRVDSDQTNKGKDMSDIENEIEEIMVSDKIKSISQD